ncbi:protein phosphatase family protein [Pelomyxa schiedti]|nr:protein phosphatase family protein [Pelomyxa schiedti]
MQKATHSSTATNEPTHSPPQHTPPPPPPASRHQHSSASATTSTSTGAATGAPPPPPPQSPGPIMASAVSPTYSSSSAAAHTSSSTSPPPPHARTATTTTTTSTTTTATTTTSRSSSGTSASTTTAASTTKQLAVGGGGGGGGGAGGGMMTPLLPLGATAMVGGGGVLHRYPAQEEQFAKHLQICREYKERKRKDKAAAMSAAVAVAQNWQANGNRIVLKAKNLGRPETVRIDPSCYAAIIMIDLSGNFFSEIPKEIWQFTQLQTLRMFGNKIKVLPQINCPTLLHLDLGKNKIETLPEDWSGVPNLRSLDINWNKISRLPSGLSTITTLHTVALLLNKITEMPVLHCAEMDISHNNFGGFPLNVCAMRNLSSLTMCANDLKDMPPQVEALTNLTKLDLRRNSLKSLPSQIGMLTNLVSLSLQKNELVVLPPEIGNLSLLRDLNVANNKLTSLPDTISGLASLRTLQMWSNNLDSLPPSFAQLTRLQLAEFSSNNISTLHSDIRNCPVVALMLNFNHFNTLPTLSVFSTEISFNSNAISGPVHIQEGKWQSISLNKNHITDFLITADAARDVRNLSLAYNNLTELHDPLFGNLRQIMNLNLSGNRLTSIPATISCLNSLQVLLLGYNRLTDLPDSLAELTSLQVLCLSGNPLRHVPTVIPSISSLKKLYMSNAHIQNLPMNLGNLHKLEVVDFTFNVITDITSLCEVTTLKDINLSHNGLRSLPDNITKLTDLRELDLSVNNLKVIPPFLGAISTLGQIHLDHNELKEFPPFIKTGPTIPPPTPYVWVEGNLVFEPLPPFADTRKLSDDPPFTPQIQAGWASMCGKRPDMQDAMVVLSEPLTLSSFHLAAIFDGHSGVTVPQLACRDLPGLLSTHLAAKHSLSHADVCDALWTAFDECQKEIASFKLGDGSAAVLALFVPTGELYVANLGDSRAVLCRNNTAIDLSDDHKPETPSELKRILQTGGFVTVNGRVFGELALSRALGDSAFKPTISGVPDISVIQLQPTDKYLILACDGVWDVLTSQEAVNIVRERDNATDAATALRDAAFLQGSTDNLSTIVFQFM